MGSRIRRSGKATLVSMLVSLGLICSAWLAYASSAPAGTSAYPGTTTTTVKTTTTSTVKATTTTSTTTIPKTTTTVCKPGYGYGDKNHCHSGPPGQNKKP